MLTKLNLYVYYSTLAMAYLATLPFIPYAGSFILKVLPIYLLAFFIFYQKRLPGSFLLLGGVLFCSLGDIWLELDSKKYFLYGLSSFLVGHILYGLCFFRNWQYRASKVWGIAVIFLFGIGMLWVIKRNLSIPMEPFFLPIVFYVLTICLMSIFALFHRGDEYKYIFSGALVFMISDSLIAIDMFIFRLPNPMGSFIIMVTYYLAQYLIVWGFFQQSELETSVKNSAA
ncbi:MAG: lysoplasmalogenase [Bacteroidia bacterium]|nr:lysoplasmalogenase [Bacteroidia bacterium]MDW8159170.1 lysoplasmalogenase [Bacteroidia bacterium]